MPTKHQEATYNALYIPRLTQDLIRGYQSKLHGDAPGRPVDLFPAGYKASVMRRAGITEEVK
jgi:hypothetical protein